MKTLYPKVMVLSMVHMNERFLSRLETLANTDREDRKEEPEDAALGAWLYELYLSEEAVRESCEASFIKAMKKGLNMNGEFPRYLQVMATEVVTLLLDAFHQANGEDVPKKDEVVKWLSAYYGALYEASQWIRFFENVVDSVTMSDYASLVMEQTIRRLMEGPVTDFLSDGVDDYFRSVLIQREIPKTHTVAQWKEAVESFVMRSFPQQKVLAQRMVDYSMGRLFELQQQEEIRFDLSISKEGVRGIDEMMDKPPGSISEEELKDNLRFISKHPMKIGNADIGYFAEITPYWIENLGCFGVELLIRKTGQGESAVLYSEDLSLDPLASFDTKKIEGLSLWSKMQNAEQELPPFEVHLHVD